MIEDPYILTLHGQRVPFEGKILPKQINAWDIAVGLANLCRYSGQVLEFYSVAQHSVLVAGVLEQIHATRLSTLYGLLHDASEAYLSDVVQPLKVTKSMAGYRTIEARFMRVIASRWGLKFPFPPEVKLADAAVFCAEVRDIHPRGHRDELLRWVPKNSPARKYASLVSPIRPLGPQEARSQYLQTFSRAWRPARVDAMGPEGPGA